MLFFFPPLLALLYVTWDYFWISFLRGERVISSPWMPVVYPLKFVMPVTCVLLLLQGVAELLRSHPCRANRRMDRAPHFDAGSGEGRCLRSGSASSRW